MAKRKRMDHARRRNNHRTRKNIQSHETKRMDL